MHLLKSLFALCLLILRQQHFLILEVTLGMIGLVRTEVLSGGTYDHYIQEDKDDEIEITFSTAWSPIDDSILEKLSRHCDSLEYYFEEPWMNFSGERFAQDWEITESEDYEDACFWDGVICPECWCINDHERYECQSCELVFSEVT